MSAKAIYVTRRGQPRPHTCHWPGCAQRIALSQLMCRDHWLRLPKHLRDGIWRTFRPGQEIDGEVSSGYQRALRAVLRYVRELQEQRV